MNREQEINAAASKYIEDNYMADGYIAISDPKDSFIEGADWADAHHILQWIDASLSKTKQDVEVIVLLKTIAEGCY